MKIMKSNDQKYKARKKEYRLENTEKRNEQRKNNYASSRPPGPPRKVRWTDHQCTTILHPSCYSDRELAEAWNRSVQAIQHKRWKLKNKDKK